MHRRRCRMVYSVRWATAPVLPEQLALPTSLSIYVLAMTAMGQPTAAAGGESSTGLKRAVVASGSSLPPHTERVEFCESLSWLSGFSEDSRRFLRYVKPALSSTMAVKLRFSRVPAMGFFLSMAAMGAAGLTFGDTSPSTRRAGMLSVAVDVAFGAGMFSSFVIWTVGEVMAAVTVVVLEAERSDTERLSAIRLARATRSKLFLCSERYDIEAVMLMSCFRRVQGSTPYEPSGHIPLHARERRKIT